MNQEKNYLLIPMDYLKCNFSQLSEEWKERKRILWELPVKPQKQNGDWTISNSSSLIKQVNEGDVVYFYVCKLPSGDKDKTKTIARVLLRGIVEEPPSARKWDEVYKYGEWSKKEEYVTAFGIGQLTTLSREDLKKDEILCGNALKQNPRGKYIPDKRSGKLSEETIALLEDAFKNRNGLQKNDFQALIDHFNNQECYFSGKIGTKSYHQSFVARNGLKYFEYHHFIQQHEGNKDNRLNEIINDSSNKICLCSNCHNQIHYGRPEDINRMLTLLLHDEEIMKMLRDKHFQSYIGEDKDPEEWIRETYHSNK